MKKRVLSLILCMCMMLGLSEFSHQTTVAFAVETQLEEITEGYYDTNIIPDKYNTGCNENTVFTVVNDATTVDGIEFILGNNGAAVYLDFYYHNKNHESEITFENYDFSEKDFVIKNMSTLGMQLNFINCKFTNCSIDLALDGDTSSYYFENCTFERFYGGGATFERCKFGGGYADGMNPFYDITVKNCYFGGFSQTNDVSAHTDAIQIFGYEGLDVENLTFSNCRIEIPAIEMEGQTTLINAPIMVQLEFSNADSILFENCIINGGGYSIYARNVMEGGTLTNLTFRNIHIGAGHLFDDIYPDVEESAVFENVVDTETLYVASVWKDENNNTHLSVSNDTATDRNLVVVTDSGTETYTIESKTTAEANGATTTEELPFDIDIILSDTNTEYVVCYDSSEAAENQIRFVNWGENPVYRRVSIETPVIDGATPGNLKGNQCDSDLRLSSISHTESNYQFYYTAKDYTYGITTDGYEVFSFLNTDGSVLEALQGGGTYLITSSSEYLTSSTGHISSFNVVSENCIEVSYDTSGGTQTTRYTFREDNVEIQALVSFADAVSDITSIQLKRNFVNGYVDSEKKTVEDWVFPENGDFPYRTFDSYVLSNYVDSTHKVYSFWRGENANPAYTPDYLSDCNFQVTSPPDSLSSYTIDYTLVFEDLTESSDADYLALFKGKNSELAIGITPTHTLKSNTTLFDTKDVSFNVNVSNLCDESIPYSIEYCIYDYYGNQYLDSEESRTLATNSQANYTLAPSLTKNGTYYIDVTVTYGDEEYRELYPFIVYEHYDYQYTSTSPFGISGVRISEYMPNDDTVFLAEEMGISNMRICVSLPDYIGTDYTLLANYLSQLNAKGTKITGQFLLASDWTVPEDTSVFATELDAVLAKVGNYLSDFEVGNEVNLKYSSLSMAEAVQIYMDKQWNPTYSIVKDKYNLPIMGAGVYLAKTDWLEAAVDAGLWDAMDILSTHAYSFPHSPDYSSDPSVDHSYESALVRIRNFMNTYGEKTWYMSEFGYPTTPGKTSGLFSGSDLRSQADYTIREFILGLSYGVDVLESYGFYDGVNTTMAKRDDNGEYHFGMFYSADYYGRIMPKPLVMSYMTMTQNLDGYTSCTEVQDKSSTSRVFEMTLQQSETPVYVCWSNRQQLTTDTSFSRTIGLPWENQWSSKEYVTFATDTYLEVLDSQGNSTIYYPDEGLVTIPVTGEPLYVRNATSVVEAAATTLKDAGQADTLIYSDIQTSFTVTLPKTIQSSVTGTGQNQTISGIIPITVKGNTELTKAISITPTDSVCKLTDEDTGFSIDACIYTENDTVINGMFLAKTYGSLTTNYRIVSINDSIAPGTYTANVTFDVNVEDLSDLTVYASSFGKTVSEEPITYGYFEGGYLMGKVAAMALNNAPITVFSTIENSNSTTVFNVPYGVSCVYSCAGMTDAESVSLPKSLHFIGATAFNNFTNITSITIPMYCYTIASGAFSGCSSLQSVVFESECSIIESNAFTGCTALNEVSFDSDAIILNDGAFNGCTALTKITLPQNLEIIRLAGNPFTECTSFSAVEYQGIEYTNNDALITVLKDNGCYVSGLFFIE